MFLGGVAAVLAVRHDFVPDGLAAAAAWLPSWSVTSKQRLAHVRSTFRIRARRGRFGRVLTVAGLTVLAVGGSFLGEGGGRAYGVTRTGSAGGSEAAGHVFSGARLREQVSAFGLGARQSEVVLTDPVRGARRGGALRRVARRLAQVGLLVAVVALVVVGGATEAAADTGATSGGISGLWPMAIAVAVAGGLTVWARRLRDKRTTNRQAGREVDTAGSRRTSAEPSAADKVVDRNLRIYFSAFILSLIGTNVQIVSLNWEVLHLGDSTALGIVSALLLGPIVLLSIPLGALINECDKRRMLSINQTLLGLSALALALLTMTHTLTLTAIYLLSLLTGICSAIGNVVDMPYLLEAAGETRRAEAISRKGVAANVGQVVGLLVAAPLVAITGIGLAFAFNALTFGAMLVALWAIGTVATSAERVPRSLRTFFGSFLMNIPRYVRHSRDAVVKMVSLFTSLGSSVMKTLRYVCQRRGLIVIIVLNTIKFGGPETSNVFLPVLARDAFHGGPQSYVMLSAALSAGRLLGSAYASQVYRKETPPTLRAVVVWTLSVGALVLATGLMPTLNFAAATLIFAGFAMSVSDTVNLQTFNLSVEHSMRSSMQGFWATAAYLLGSFSVPALGSTAPHLGPRMPAVIGGAIGVVPALAAAVVIGWLAVSTAAPAEQNVLIGTPTRRRARDVFGLPRGLWPALVAAGLSMFAALSMAPALWESIRRAGLSASRRAVRWSRVAWGWIIRGPPIPVLLGGAVGFGYAALGLVAVPIVGGLLTWGLRSRLGPWVSARTRSRLGWLGLGLLGGGIAGLVGSASAVASGGAAAGSGIWRPLGDRARTDPWWRRLVRASAAVPPLGRHDGARVELGDRQRLSLRRASAPLTAQPPALGEVTSRSAQGPPASLMPFSWRHISGSRRSPGARWW